MIRVVTEGGTKEIRMMNKREKKRERRKKYKQGEKNISREIKRKS